MPTRTDMVDILLVDDREDNLIALEALFSVYKNYRLVKAMSGHEAIGLLDDYDFAVILLDVQMPELDGFETAAIIRRRPRHRAIPIIFVTAIDKDERYVYRGYEAGAVDYLFKPFDPMILQSKVGVFADLHLKNRLLREQSKQLVEREMLEQKARQQSRELENLRRYRALAESIPHIVLRANPSGELEYNNHLWAEYTGMSHQDSLGRGWQKAIFADDLPAALNIWTQAMRDGSHYETECRIRRRDGCYRWHWIKAEPDKDAEGNVIAWLGTCTDIEDRKSSESRIQEAQRQAEAANDAKTHFLANMSHEIRTPLNAIMGFTELLFDPTISPEEQLKGLSIVRRNCHQLMKIVDEILDISKVEAGELVTEKIETSILDMLNELRMLLMVQARKKNIDLKFQTVSPVPAKVMTDSTRLRQILLNIVGNALKFTQSGSITVATRFASIEGRPMLSFTVIDTGVGIDNRNAERIFQPFSQADSSTTRIFGGTGLGLALARRLARAMGGDVKLLKSEVGQGSSFLVTIEVEVHSDTEWIARASVAAESELARPLDLPDAAQLKGKRILLVEDAEDNQFLIQQFLSRTGAILEMANNGEEGVRKALANDYEVVLMDIQMPLVDGYQATTQLRQAGYTKPIIALTAHALIEEREKSLRTGCSGHLTKPIDRRQLIESLIQTLST